MSRLAFRVNKKRMNIGYKDVRQGGHYFGMGGHGKDQCGYRLDPRHQPKDCGETPSALMKKLEWGQDRGCIGERSHTIPPVASRH